ncbi:nucleotidyl transferase AbiEii/AbiGii toxin family protein [Pedobacter sp. N23S346]|uniref:nucleotidyl transferase AbiEii/AbiGii toxin family protein n=1 Tax=Pedobacter sp. N23S346 TaxID=3402750 RepID=UPI003AC7EF7C
MLHKETVTPGTLDLIQTLMQDHQLNSFYLVGGTALSLRIGHRESIDIDFSAHRTLMVMNSLYT